MLFNPVLGAESKELPLTLFECEVRLVNEAPTLTFVPSAYTLESGEAERVAVDHVARAVQADASGSCAQLTSHLLSVQSAAKMLAQRVRMLHDYVADVADGRVPVDHGLLRQVASLLRQLPAADPVAFEGGYMAEVCDALLMVYLTAQLKGVSNCAHLTERLVLTHAEAKGRRTTTVRGMY